MSSGELGKIVVAAATAAAAAAGIVRTRTLRDQYCYAIIYQLCKQVRNWAVNATTIMFWESDVFEL